MSRSAQLLLFALILQLAGLRGLCVPAASQPTDCCPPAHEKPVPAPSQLPECCLISGLRCQGSIVRVETRQESLRAMSHVEVPSVELPVPAPGLFASQLRHFSHPISPQLSPLLQTCLLRV